VVSPHSARQPIALAVVAGRAGTRPRLCRAVLVQRCQLPVGQAHTLRLRLDGPGRVAVTEPAGARPDPDTTANWPDLLDRVPPLYRPDANACDLVFGVDLTGTPPEVARRIGLVSDVIDFVEDNHSEPDTVRFGVLGYREHVARQRTTVVERVELGSADAARAFIANLVAAPGTDRYAAVEDALAAARSRMSWRPRPTARRFVLVGARRPYPAVDGRIAKCPYDLDWGKQLRLLGEADVNHIAVWDQPDWAKRDSAIGRETVKEWLDLARPTNYVLLGAITAAQVAAKAQALGSATKTPPLLFPLTARINR
jgi:hypothetical protein